MTPARHPALEPTRAAFLALEKMPLRVVLELVPGSRITHHDPLNLDNLLARAVVEETFGSSLIPGLEDGHPESVPAPLGVLWQSDEGWPLYASTPFAPADAVTDDISYLHKRAQPGRFTGTKSGNFAIRSTQGRYMERRIPMPTRVCDTWTADAIGHPETVARLLARFAFVGRKRGVGFGEVRSWRVEPLERFELVRDGRLTRNMPADAAHLLEPYDPDGEPSPVAWTPPQWAPALYRPGWWHGTPVALDFLEGAAGEPLAPAWS